MGGGDLNMKKSWHPALMKNQEQVWLKEKDALEEKKKLAQLRKEKEEERQMQELQRLQEEQTGRKRQDRLDWMYATPASGSTANAADLEEYLLGKKRVDKLLIGDEHAKLGASHKDFIAVQNANTQRDIQNKVREDPLLAMKQQEQAALESLKNNPLRLRELQAKAGGKKDKKERKEKRKRDRSRSRSPDRRRRSRSGSPRRRSTRDRDDYDRDRDYDHDYDRDRRHRSRSRSPRRRYSDEGRRDDRDRDYGRERDRARDYRRNSRSRGRSPPRRERRRSASPPPRRDRRRSASPPPRRDSARSGSDEGSRNQGPPMHPARAAMLANNRPPPPPPPQRAGPSQAERDAERAARLAAMSSSAKEVSDERQARLTDLVAREKEELAREDAARARTSKHGVGSFLDKERSRALMGSEGDLGERIRRNRSALVGVD